MKHVHAYILLWSVLLWPVFLISCSHAGEKAAVAEQVQQVADVHAYLRAHYHLPSSPDIDSLAHLLEKEGEGVEAGKAYYVSGAGKNIVGDDEGAMEALKHAEKCLAESDHAPFYRGMTYYKMGRISENEQLYEVALHFYRLSLPYLEQHGEPLYLASVYRELARMSMDSMEQRALFDQALHWAERSDTLTYLDIRYAMLSRVAPHSPERMAISCYMCDSMGQKRYAQDVVREALREGDYARAEQYLKLLQADSTNRNWSQRTEAYLHSMYLHRLGNDQQAFVQMQELYDQQTAQLEADGRVRSYAIAQRFDNAAEREKNLQLEVRQQHLYALLAGIIACIIVLFSAALIMYSHTKNKHRLQQAAIESEVAQLRKELVLRQQTMRKVLQQRLELNKNLQESTLRHQETNELPEWARAFVETNIFQSEDQWMSFKNEFNEAYMGLLDQLKEEHPALTAADQQVIAFILLGLEISDICLLLNLTKRTVWTRRLRIKEHLGLSEGEQLDEWLNQRASVMPIVESSDIKR